jgi:hypothetical protein
MPSILQEEDMTENEFSSSICVPFSTPSITHRKTETNAVRHIQEQCIDSRGYT